VRRDKSEMNTKALWEGHRKNREENTKLGPSSITTKKNLKKEEPRTYDTPTKKELQTTAPRGIRRTVPGKKKRARRQAPKSKVKRRTSSSVRTPLRRESDTGRAPCARGGLFKESPTNKGCLTRERGRTDAKENHKDALKLCGQGKGA